MGRTPAPDRPNALAFGFLFILTTLGMVASTVDGATTIIFVAATFGILYIMRLLAKGWKDPRRATKSQGPAPAATPIPVRRRRHIIIRMPPPSPPLARGRVVRAPRNVRVRTPTV